MEAEILQKEKDTEAGAWRCASLPLAHGWQHEKRAKANQGHRGLLWAVHVTRACPSWGFQNTLLGLKEARAEPSLPSAC